MINLLLLNYKIDKMLNDCHIIEDKLNDSELHVYNDMMLFRFKSNKIIRISFVDILSNDYTLLKDPLMRRSFKCLCSYAVVNKTIIPDNLFDILIKIVNQYMRT